LDFKLTKEQVDIHKAARTFAEGEFDADLVSGLEKRGQFPHEVFQKACELGFIGMTIPEKYGGQGLGNLENALVFEAFCRQDSSMGLALTLCDLGSDIILKFGNDSQLQGYAPSICSGTSVISLAYMEEGQNPVPKYFNTRATEQDGGYSINGAKTFVFNTTLAGPMILLCRLEKESGANGNAAFVFEKGTSGLFSSVLGDRVGMRMVPIANVTITNLRLPYESLMGNENDGPVQMDLLMMAMHIKAAAVGIGIAQGAFDMALAYARQREQFGRKIASFDAIRGKLTDMATKIELSRLLTYNACWSLDVKNGNSALCNMAKVVASETALDVSKDALHIFGGYGYVIDYRIERFYRDASMVDIIGLPMHAGKKILADDIVGKI
jgi:acyl-CoA dehydrogenase